MHGQNPDQSRSFTLEEIEDQQDLKAVIVAALAATPLDEASLRRGVWTYVRAEHHLGTSPGAVIVTLTELVEASAIRAPLVHQTVMRQVILWCVEAYFGHLGGQGLRVDEGRAKQDSMAPGPRIVSNR